MGGDGSGRDGWRGTVEACQVIDANELFRKARQQMGKTRQWLPPEQITASYSVPGPGGHSDDVTLPLRIVNVPCRFGGRRPFFICPGVPYRSVCARRVIKLYLSRGLFLCLAIASPIPARTRTPWLAPCAAPPRSGGASAPRPRGHRFRRGQRACGSEPTSAYGTGT